jgi:hypothetical protein
MMSLIVIITSLEVQIRDGLGPLRSRILLLARLEISLGNILRPLGSRIVHLSMFGVGEEV